MRKIFLFSLVLLLVANVSAQKVTVDEPEFAEQILLLTSDSSGALLTRENGFIKEKKGASLYLVGIGKSKVRLTLKGKASTSSAKGGSTTRLIVKAKDNLTDPNSFINIFKFEISGNERRYQLSEAGTLSKTEISNLSNVSYNAKKYKDNSYYIVMTDLKPGEYGILFGDPNNSNTKNDLKVTTFTVE